MKKKALMTIMPLCVAMAMTACGGNAGTAEVKEITVAEETAEADAQTEAEAEAAAKAQKEAEEQEKLAEAGRYYEAGRRSLYGLDGAQIDLEDAHTNFTKSQELGNTDANFYLGVLADWYGYPKKDYEQARAYYEQSGDNPYAQISLGFLYYNGQGVEQDMEKGKELFQSVADTGVIEGYYGLASAAENEWDFETALEHYNKVVEDGTEPLYIAGAMRGLGYMYLDGKAVERDIEKGVEWYTKAADLGDISAMNNLGNLYKTGEEVVRDGEKVEQDGEKAIEWYTKAADSGNTSAMYNIGYMYMEGEAVEQDGEKAIEWYTKAVDLGNATAMNDLGYMYNHGKGVEQDIEKGVEWYTKAADSGNTTAMHNLGYLYYTGDVVEQDIEKAVEWYTKAADSGNTSAMHNLGYLYYTGDVVEQDYAKAIEWYTKAVDLGNTDVMDDLGYMYAKGEGVEQDDDKALEWYVKSLSSFPDYEVYEKIVDILHGEDAAEKWFEESGDAEKMIALAETYRVFDYSNERLPDFDKIVEWYTKAADLGSSDAMKRLGELYLFGSYYGMEDDLEKAIEWYQKAADLGNAEARYYAGLLQEQ